MQKISLYFILIPTSLLIASLQAMEEIPKGLDRIKISALLNAKEEAPYRGAIEKRFSITCIKESLVKDNLQKQLNESEITASIKRLADKMPSQNKTQVALRFHNFFPSKKSKKGYAEDTERASGAIVLKIPAAQSQTTDNDANRAS